MVDQGEVRAGLTVLLHDLEELNDHLRHGAHQNLALAPLLGVVHGLREVGFRVSENPKKNAGKRASEWPWLMSASGDGARAYLEGVVKHTDAHHREQLMSCPRAE